MCPSRKARVTGCQSPGSSGPPQARARAASDRGVRVRAVGPGPVARLERHHERQPGLGELAAEPVLIPVGAVRGHRPEREPRLPGPDRQVRADRQLGPEPRVALPLREVPRRGVRHRVHRVIQPLIGPHRGDGDHPVVGLAVPAQPLMAHVRGLLPSLRSPLSSITSTPAVRGGRRIRQQQLQPPGIDPLRIPPRLRQEELQPLHRRCCAPATGSAPASAVSVLFRSRGASSPARYSRNPRRCANEPNRSSNRAAYPSSGPGATGHGRRRVITHPTAGHATTLPAYREPAPRSTNYR